MLGLFQEQVIYHAHCPDGFAAAWAVWKQLGDEATYHPWQYGQEPPAKTGERLIIVDFSFKRPIMEQLIETWPELLCLDHHKTAQADLEGLPGCFFDMNRSGAAMAWDYFHGDIHARSWVIDYVQDRDLWHWELPHSREVSAWTMAQPHTFEAWQKLEQDGLSNAVAMGTAIRTHIAHYCEHMAQQIRAGYVGGHLMPVINAPMFNVSDLLHEVCQLGHPMACAWWQRGDGQYQYSLRSIGDDDVSQIAKFYGGGGHRNASGFQTTEFVIEWSLADAYGEGEQ